MILFLNKSDLFAEKIKSGKSIKVAFPDYNGNGSFEDSAKFIQNKFSAGMLCASKIGTLGINLRSERPADRQAQGHLPARHVRHGHE